MLPALRNPWTRLTVFHMQGEHHGIPNLCAWIAGQERLGCDVRQMTSHERVDEQVPNVAEISKPVSSAFGLEHKRFLDEAAIGVTASRIVRHASCPVLAVPA